MLRILIAGLVGGLIYFIWGMMAWMALPLHTPTINGLPAESEISQALQDQGLETGVYTIPFLSNEDDWQSPESDFAKAHAAGPIVSIYYQKNGAAPMPTKMLAGGFVIDFVAAALAACLLSSMGSCCNGYWCRVGFVAGMGIFVAFVGHASYWNWMYFPAGYTIAFMVDVIVGWTLAGFAIAALIKPVASVVSVDITPKAAADPVAAPTPAPEKFQPDRNDAISLLAALQREARFVDIVKEPLSGYSDAQVGAAARDVLRDCGAVLDRLFQLRPILNQEEGSEVQLPSGFDAMRYRITGNAASDSDLTGALTHHGWQATQCELPRWSGSKDAALIVAPAELEVK